MSKIKFMVVNIRNSEELKGARKLKKKGVYVYAFLSGGYQPGPEELKESTNIFFRAGDEKNISYARDLIINSFSGDSMISVSFDELSSIEDSGIEGFIGFGKDAETILNSHFCLGKTIQESKKLIVSIIANAGIRLKDINRELEVLSEKLNPEIDIYFGNKTEKDKKEMEILAIGI